MVWIVTKATEPLNTSKRWLRRGRALSIASASPRFAGRSSLGGISAAVTPLVSWAFPNQAPARARLEQARATERAALAGWDVAVLRALREVETALATYDAETRRNRDLATASREAQAYARRAGARVRRAAWTRSRWWC